MKTPDKHEDKHEAAAPKAPAVDVKELKAWVRKEIQLSSCGVSEDERVILNP